MLNKATSLNQHHLDYRCNGCNKLLFKGILIDSKIEVKCKRCNQMNQFQGEPVNDYVCLIKPCPNRVAVK